MTLDDILIDRIAQPVVDWAEPWATQRQMARGLTIAMIGASITESANYLRQGDGGGAALSFLVAAIWVPFYSIPDLYRHNGRAWRRMSLAALCFFGLTCLPHPSLSNVLAVIFWSAQLAARCIMACRKPPPRRRVPFGAMALAKAVR